MPEKDIFNFFRILDIDKGYLDIVKKLIDKRNDMAHATGSLQIHTIEDFNVAMQEVLTVSNNILKSFEKHLRAWYEKDCLLKYAVDKIEEYPEPIDFISEEIIAVESLSINELKICSNIGIRKFKDWKKYPQLNKSHITTISDFQFAINVKLKDLLDEI